MVVITNCCTANPDCQYSKNFQKLLLDEKQNGSEKEKLNVICVISNPCNFKTRWKLAKEFIARMERTENVDLYIVEMIYPKLNETFQITNKYNPKHLQLVAEVPLWHKENMVNIGIRRLLPVDWKNVAWIDADIEFENDRWVEETLQKLSGQNPNVVQLFSHAVDMDADGNAMTIFQGSIYQFVNKLKRGPGIHYWHPGYAWAINRSTYESMDGLFDMAILGSADDHMMRTWIGETSWISSVHSECNLDYKNCIEQFAYRCHKIDCGYVQGVIKHYFHGSKLNRKYRERWEILVKHQFSPLKHITKDEQGIIVPTETCPKDLLKDIMLYFQERNEDEK